MEYPHHFGDTLTPALRQGTPVFPDNSCQGPPLLFTYYGKAIESESRSLNKNTHSCCSSNPNYFLIFCTPLYIPKPKEKKVYSKFPSPFKLVMGSATDAFTTRDINFFIRPKVLEVNSVYCMRCQGNYRWSAPFLRTAGLLSPPPRPPFTDASPQHCSTSIQPSFLIERVRTMLVLQREVRKGVWKIKSSQAK